MSDQLNLQNSTQCARRFTATINNNGRLILQSPLNCQAVSQNIRGADV